MWNNLEDTMLTEWSKSVSPTMGWMTAHASSCDVLRGTCIISVLSCRNARKCKETSYKSNIQSILQNSWLLFFKSTDMINEKERLKSFLDWRNLKRHGDQRHVRSWISRRCYKGHYWDGWKNLNMGWIFDNSSPSMSYSRIW